MLDLRILNGVVVNHDRTLPRDIGIEGGKIVAVDVPGSLGAAREEIDATGLHVIPGGIDVHFHCRAPSHPERGDFASESAAAAAGGVTTIFEMPISEPACSTPEVFHRRRELGERDSYVNFALYSGAALPGPDQAREMAAAGAIAFKLFTLAPAPARESEFRGLWANTEADIYESLQAVAATGLSCVIHAENEPLVRFFAAQPAVDGVPPRPPVVEAAAIALVAAIAKEAAASIHIAHVSSRFALDAVRGAVALGASVTAETCPQYLLLDASAIKRYGPIAKIAPPLREPADVEALWGGLLDGTLSVVSSDHSPFLAHEKMSVDYAHAPQGLPTVEILVPSMLDAAARGVLPLELAISLITYAPARRFGLFPEKGQVACGADADITLVSLTEAFRPGRDHSLLTRGADCGVAFQDMSLAGRIKTTIVGGRTVYADHRVNGVPRGRFVPGRAASALAPAYADD
jgi:dihydroorotase (multifunctional complex type)